MQAPPRKWFTILLKLGTIPLVCIFVGFGLADGLHMASHAAALSINAFAYVYARKHAHDARFSFGTGKVNSLGGFTGAILLAIFALIMVVESLERMVNPVEIEFNQSIFVAIVGLVAISASDADADSGDEAAVTTTVFGVVLLLVS